MYPPSVFSEYRYVWCVIYIHLCFCLGWRSQFFIIFPGVFFFSTQRFGCARMHFVSRWCHLQRQESEPHQGLRCLLWRQEHPMNSERQRIPGDPRQIWSTTTGYQWFSTKWKGFGHILHHTLLYFRRRHQALCRRWHHWGVPSEVRPPHSAEG